MNFHRVLTRVSVFIAHYDLHIQESRDFHFRFSECINFLLRVSIPITSLVCLRFTSGCVFTLSLLYLYCVVGNGTPLQYSYLENPMDGGAWQAAVHGVAESWTRLSDFTFTFLFHALEKEMAPHSSVLAWRIPGMVEPGGLPTMGSHRVRHD